MTKLSVNVNKVAWLRNARHGDVPSVLHSCRVALDAGAHGITVHPRPDQRHIRIEDVSAIRDLLRADYPDAEYNIEGNPLDVSHGDHLLPLLRAAKPDQATFVPDDTAQSTSDHGFPLRADTAGDEWVEKLTSIVAEMHAQGTRVSLFMDPVPKWIDRVPETGADRIELYTEGYAKAHAAGGPTAADTLATYRRAAEHAATLGLGVNAGHDLNLDNLADLAAIPNLLEVSIGHALVADALWMGMDAAVRKYLTRLESPVS